ncbi:MAG: arginine--tRNA ligase [Campylobacteraceae bacterium]|nr:arginine--tRNA ligase [Campylobacteraceae bacterium]
MKLHAIEAIAKAFEDSFALEKPKDANFGHYAVPVFEFAKIWRKAPQLIAQELAAKFTNNKTFSKTEAIGGYINFTLSDTFLDYHATKAIKNPSNFAKGAKEGSYLFEFVSANPTGPLHIGHARGAIYGDALCRIGRHLGYKITSEYYINDAGNQIDLLGLSIFLSGREHVCKLNVKWPEEFYRGEYIIQLAHEAAKELGKSVFEDELNIPNLSTWGKDRMLILIKQNLADVGIVFEQFVSEKSLYDKWEESFSKLKNSKSTYEVDGKIWIRSTLQGDEKDRVVVREDGRPTYLAGDIIYHDDKFNRKYDGYVNIWGADHHGYIARVKAAIHFLGYDEKKLEVLLAQMVSLLKGGEPYKMSKRAGNFILMSEVVEEIGQDALRFIFLSKKCDTHLEFDVDVLKQHDSSNPIFYINYAHARIHQIYQKSGKTPEDLVNYPLVNLSADAKNILFQALLLGEVIEDAFSSRQVQKLTDYLKALAASFHKFYNENRVVGAENEDGLLKLFAVVAISLRIGLKLIGIEAKARM